MSFAHFSRAKRFLLAAVVFASAGLNYPSIAQAPPVSVVEATQAPVINRVTVSGTVVADRASRLSTDIGGLVLTRAVKIGDRVNAGDTLFQLDATLDRIELERTEAATREAKERLADTERRLEIARQLAEQKNVSQNELDSRQAERRIALAALDRLKAEEAQQRERVRRHTIAAPYSGVVAELVAEEGEWVTPGAALLQLVETDQLKVDVAVPQRHFPEFKTGTRVTLTFDAIPDKTVSASIDALVPVSDADTRTFIVRLSPASSDTVLTPGMSARAAFDLDTGTQGIIIPRDAVIRYPDGRVTVWVTAGKTGTVEVEERQIVLGNAFNGNVHVKDGLAEGEAVVIRGNESLLPGDQVRITEPAG